MFKTVIKSSTPFTLQNALELLKLKHPISNTRERSKAMEMIFYKLEELGSIPQVLSQTKRDEDSKADSIDFSQLPNHPGGLFV